MLKTHWGSHFIYLHNIISTSWYLALLMCFQGLKATLYLRGTLHYLPFLSLSHNHHSSSRRGLQSLNPFVIHSQFACTYDFLPDLNLNTALQFSVSQCQIIPPACFPLPALRLHIARKSHWTAVNLVRSL